MRPGPQATTHASRDQTVCLSCMPTRTARQTLRELDQAAVRRWTVVRSADPELHDRRVTGSIQIEPDNSAPLVAAARPVAPLGSNRLIWILTAYSVDARTMYETQSGHATWLHPVAAHARRLIACPLALLCGIPGRTRSFSSEQVTLLVNVV
jgi:hypothetical protein